MGHIVNIHKQNLKVSQVYAFCQKDASPGPQLQDVSVKMSYCKILENNIQTFYIINQREKNNNNLVIIFATPFQGAFAACA